MPPLTTSFELRSLQPQTTVRLFIETDEVPSAFPRSSFLELWRFDLFPCTEMLSGRLGEASQTAVLSEVAPKIHTQPQDLLVTLRMGLIVPLQRDGSGRCELTSGL
jgi:hypothetical protein